MSDLPSTTEVLIIGGGVMGVSTAYHLALRGVKDIVLLERGPFFGQGATGKCAGGIRHQFATEVNIRLSLASLKMLSNFEAETGQAIDLRWCGYLFLLTREEDVAAFHRNVALQRSLGVMTEWLTGDEARRRIPLIHALSVRTRKPYVVLRKNYKPYMGETVQAETLSITTGAPQTLHLDEKDHDLVKEKRVVLVDDVISTGSTLQGMRLVLQKAGARVVAESAIFTEGERAQWENIVALGHLPVFTG